MAKKPKDKAKPHLPPIGGQYMQRMGEGDFAQTPQSDCIIRQWPRACAYRSGVTNSFKEDVRLVSGIRENLQYDELIDYGDDKTVGSSRKD